MSGLTGGIIGQMIYKKSFIYIDTSLYSSFVIICHGYNSGAVVDDKYTISNYSNYIKRTANGNNSFNLFKKDYCYCIQIPDNSVAFVGISISWGPLIIEDSLRDGYGYYNF